MLFSSKKMLQTSRVMMQKSQLKKTITINYITEDESFEYLPSIKITKAEIAENLGLAFISDVLLY
jgi:hypothetical protein